MSNLKRDIDQLVRKSLKDYALWAKMALESELPYPSTVDDYNKALEGVADLTTTQIINLIESVVGEDEDLPEDVSSVGFDEWQKRYTRNQFRADIKSKLIGKE